MDISGVEESVQNKIKFIDEKKVVAAVDWLSERGIKLR